MMRARLFVVGASLLVLGLPAGAETVSLSPSQDNTLYESMTGALSNGAGAYIFAGNTNLGLARRALLAFDIAAVVPAGATITRAKLTLDMSRTVAGSPPSSFSLRAGTSGGGGGGGEPSRFSNTHLPRTTGDVRFGCEVTSSTLPCPSSPARRSSGYDIRR